MSNEAIKNAMQLIEQGHIEQGAPILINLLAYKRAEDAWAWLYSCVKTDTQKIYCIRKILEINPRHQKAQNALVELKLREAKSIGQFDILDIEEIRTDHPVKQETVAIPVEHKEITEDNKPTTLPTQEQELGNEYEQALLLGFTKPENNISADNSSNAVILGKNKSTHKSKDELKSNQEISDEDLEASPKSTEPHVFNPKLYSIIRTKADENRFAETKSYSGFPETDSGMYGRRLLIGGIPITSFDHPYCIDIGRVPSKSRCHNCEFFALRECPIRRDPIILKDAITLFAQNKRYSREYEETRQRVIETIFIELKEHGRPLHYEVITSIVHDRHPKLKLNSWKTLRIMSSHPERFEWVDVGVYEAK